MCVNIQLAVLPCAKSFTVTIDSLASQTHTQDWDGVVFLHSPLNQLLTDKITRGLGHVKPVGASQS